MAELRVIYDEIMADLVSKGFGGLVQQLDHDYKNTATVLPKPVVDTSYTTKTKNEEPAVRPLSGGFSLLSVEVVY